MEPLAFNSISLYIIISYMSAIGFAWLRNIWHRVPGIFYVLHSIIVLWSATMYLNFLFQTPVSHITWYLDWLISTPFIVLALALTAQFQRQRIAWDVTTLIICAQALTIVTGLLGHVTTSKTGMYIWFTIGCIMMLLVWYIIWIPLMRIAREHSTLLYNKYQRIGLFVIALWATYPIVWIISPIGLCYISNETTRILFVILPLLCKPGFGFLDLYYLHQITTTQASSSKQKRDT